MAWAKSAAAPLQSALRARRVPSRDPGPVVVRPGRHDPGEHGIPSDQFIPDRCATDGLGRTVRDDREGPVEVCRRLVPAALIGVDAASLPEQPAIVGGELAGPGQVERGPVRLVELKQIFRPLEPEVRIVRGPLDRAVEGGHCLIPLP